MGALDGRTVAFLTATEGIEQIELTDPREALEDAGARTVLVSLEEGEVQGFDHLTAADTFPVDVVVDDADAGDYDALVLPGGVANPDQLRLSDTAMAFVAAFFEQGKPVASICHAAWSLVEADVVRGRTLTSWPSLRTDILNAGGEWVDREVVVCDDGPNLLITSRKPDDLAAFDREVVAALA